MKKGQSTLTCSLQYIQLVTYVQNPIMLIKLGDMDTWHMLYI